MGFSVKWGHFLVYSSAETLKKTTWTERTKRCWVRTYWKLPRTRKDRMFQAYLFTCWYLKNDKVCIAFLYAFIFTPYFQPYLLSKPLWVSDALNAVNVTCGHVQTGQGCVKTWHSSTWNVLLSFLLPLATMIYNIGHTKDYFQCVCAVLF